MCRFAFARAKWARTLTRKREQCLFRHGEPAGTVCSLLIDDPLQIVYGTFLAKVSMRACTVTALPSKSVVKSALDMNG